MFVGWFVCLVWLIVGISIIFLIVVYGYSYVVGGVVFGVVVFGLVIVGLFWLCVVDCVG